MIECNTINDICSYTCGGTPPLPSQLLCGVAPLDTLPAEWWNWMWSDTNTALAEAHTTFGSVVTEILNVLADVGITPDSECTDQLKEALYKLHRTTTANTLTAGTVKSGEKVQINNDGTMTAVGLGNAAYCIVDKINTVKQYHDCCSSAIYTSTQTACNNQLRCICLGTSVSTIKEVNNHILSLGLGNAACCNVEDFALDISDYATPSDCVLYADNVTTATSAASATYICDAVCMYNNCACCVQCAKYVTDIPGGVCTVSYACQLIPGLVEACSVCGGILSTSFSTTAAAAGTVCISGTRGNISLRSCGPAWVFFTPWWQPGYSSCALYMCGQRAIYVNGTAGPVCACDFIGWIRAW